MLKSAPALSGAVSSRAYGAVMARMNGEPGRAGIVIAGIGVPIMLFGVFAGAELRGLAAFGFVLALIGILVTLFGVLREVSDRFGGKPS